MSDQQTTGCRLPRERPAICPACGATEADSGCRIDSPNKPVLAEIARLHADPDRRVTELLEANNREVERRRRAEAELAQHCASRQAGSPATGLACFW